MAIWNIILGQVKVAKKLGRTQSYLSKIESGQRRLTLQEAIGILY
jgi:transcriptional regulator with XRE-family HTH domain